MDADTVARLRALRAARAVATETGESLAPLVELPLAASSSSSLLPLVTSPWIEDHSLGPAGAARAMRLAQGDNEPPRRSFRRDDTNGYLDLESLSNAEKPIGESNRGYRLMVKMGWKQGQGLGKEGNEGRVEPVHTTMSVNDSHLGLGKATEYNSVSIRLHFFQNFFLRIDSHWRPGAR